MITGKGANVMYWGGILIVVVVAVGIMVLSYASKAIPTELGMILTAALGFVFGAHVAPPNVGKHEIGKEDDDEGQ